MTTRLLQVLSLATATALTAVLGLSSGLASASAEESPVQDPVAAVAAAAPEALKNTIGSSASHSENAEQKLASESTPTLTLSKNGATLVTINAPFGDTAHRQPTSQEGVTAYENGNGTSSVAITHTDGSVAFDTVIWDPKAPTTYSYALGLPGGERLQQNASGTISILDASGAWIGGVKPAWARDAKGHPIPTHYEISGSALIQVVDSSQPDTAFPVVADPWFGQDLIDHVTWVPGDPQWGPTAQVYPTDYGRDQIAVGPEANEAAWGEALEKGDRSRLDQNNLHDQFSCHFLGRTKTAAKDSWNLDSNRPDVGLAATIAASCNPDGSEE